VILDSPLRNIRGMGLVMPYFGSKRQLLPKILPIIPPHKTYVEAFGGGAAVFFAKPPAERSILNDRDPFIARFYQRFSCNAVDRCKKIKNVCEFAEKARERVAEGSSDICDQIAARRFSIVSDVTGGMKKTECKIRPVVTKQLSKKCGEYEKRLRKATITSDDFRDVFRRHDGPDTFTFMDPPYPGTTQPYRGDPKSVRPADVCALAKRAKGKVLITYNDIPEVRKACKGLFVKVVPSTHRSAHVTRTSPKRKELFITNYPI